MGFSPHDYASFVAEQRAISGQLHDPHEVRANAFAAEFVMPRDAVKAWGRERVSKAVSLKHVVLLALQVRGQRAGRALRVQNADVLIDARRCTQLRDAIAVELAQRRRLQPPHDELADTAGCRGSRPLCATASRRLLAGETDVEALAQRTGRETSETAAMLAGLGID